MKTFDTCSINEDSIVFFFSEWKRFKRMILFCSTSTNVYKLTEYNFRLAGLSIFHAQREMFNVETDVCDRSRQTAVSDL